MKDLNDLGTNTDSADNPLVIEGVESEASPENNEPQAEGAPSAEISEEDYEKKLIRLSAEIPAEAQSATEQAQNQAETGVATVTNKGGTIGDINSANIFGNELKNGVHDATAALFQIGHKLNADSLTSKNSQGEFPVGSNSQTQYIASLNTISEARSLTDQDGNDYEPVPAQPKAEISPVDTSTFEPLPDVTPLPENTFNNLSDEEKATSFKAIADKLAEAVPSNDVIQAPSTAAAAEGLVKGSGAVEGAAKNREEFLKRQQARVLGASTAGQSGLETGLKAVAEKDENKKAFETKEKAFTFDTSTAGKSGLETGARAVAEKDENRKAFETKENAFTFDTSNAGLSGLEAGAKAVAEKDKNRKAFKVKEANHHHKVAETRKAHVAKLRAERAEEAKLNKEETNKGEPPKKPESDPDKPIPVKLNKIQEKINDLSKGADEATRKKKEAEAEAAENARLAKEAADKDSKGKESNLSKMLKEAREARKKSKNGGEPPKDPKKPENKSEDPYKPKPIPLIRQVVAFDNDKPFDIPVSESDPIKVPVKDFDDIAIDPELKKQIEDAESEDLPASTEVPAVEGQQTSIEETPYTQTDLDDLAVAVYRHKEKKWQDNQVKKPKTNIFKKVWNRLTKVQPQPGPILRPIPIANNETSAEYAERIAKEQEAAAAAEAENQASQESEGAPAEGSPAENEAAPEAKPETPPEAKTESIEKGKQSAQDFVKQWNEFIKNEFNPKTSDKLTTLIMKSTKVDRWEKLGVKPDEKIDFKTFEAKIVHRGFSDQYKGKKINEKKQAIVEALNAFEKKFRESK